MTRWTGPELAAGWQIISAVMWGCITAAAVAVVIGLIAAAGCDLTPSPAEAQIDGSAPPTVLRIERTAAVFVGPFDEQHADRARDAGRAARDRG